MESCVNVIQARRERRRQHRQQPIKDSTALLGLLPFFITWSLVTLYLILQPSILHHHLIPFVFYVGLINAYSVGRIITAHLVKNDFPYANVLVLPLVWAILNSLGSRSQVMSNGPLTIWPTSLVDEEGQEGSGGDYYQVPFVFGCLGLAVGVYGSFVVSPPPPFFFNILKKKPLLPHNSLLHHVIIVYI